MEAKKPWVHWLSLLLFEPHAFLWSEQATTGQRNKKLRAGRRAAFAAAAFGLRQRARNLRGIPTAVIYQNKQRMYNKPPVRTAPRGAKDTRSKQKQSVLQATICNTREMNWESPKVRGPRSSSEIPW
uniref:Putative secreted protein n=1 Tax=Amblyomma triste TaxID=251400 RepID=A0A023G4J2_AMBTT